MLLIINTDSRKDSRISWTGDLLVKDVELANEIFGELIDSAVSGERLKETLKDGKLIPTQA